jgi:hypothetical protein
MQEAYRRWLTVLGEYDAAIQLWLIKLTSRVAMRPSFVILKIYENMICCSGDVKEKFHSLALGVYQVMTEMIPILLSACGVTGSMTCQWVAVALGEIKIVLGDIPETRQPACLVWLSGGSLR